MPPSLADQIETQAEAARQLYHRLVLVVGEARTGKTIALRHLAERQGWPLINLNLTLAEQLLELTSRQRAPKTARVVGDIVADHPGDVVLVDNTEMLFHPELKLDLDPLRLPAIRFWHEDKAAEIHQQIRACVRARATLRARVRPRR